MGFLSALADQISSQFSLGENTNHTLDSIDPDTGKVEKYGSLGDFAKHFDQSSERRYVEEGYLRKDPYNTDPKQFEILMQEPNATVLIKKKMFSSVGDNFRPDFMDDNEKLYYKTIKVLFQNKCKQIAALEKLSKIQKITSAIGSVPDQLMPIIFTLTDSFNSGLDSGSNLFGALGGPLASDASNFTKTVDRIRRIYSFNSTNTTTNWITDSTNLFQSKFGQGTGVIEITNFSNLSTTTSTDLNNPGNFSLTISDPYECMLITEYDIEKAISDATNMFYNKKLFQFGKENSANLINDLQARLNHIRASRNASPLSIKVDPNTLLGKRVTVIFDRLGIELPFTYDSSSAASIFSGGAFGNGVSVAPEYLRGGAIVGNDGIDTQKQIFGDMPFSSLSGIRAGTHTGSDSELSIFNRIISTIYSKLSQDANSQNAFQNLNKDTNYVRRKMRFNFAGSLIIDPMDTVHIYMNSKSRYDTKLLSGLQNMFNGLGMLQNLNNTLTNLTNAVGALNPSGNVPLEIEKSVFVGSDFPNFLWSLVRGQFVSENEGTHVFAGVVQSAVDNWADGKFVIDVRGADNTLYFDMGKINFKPGADVYNGSIFDPLTPFKSNYDSINGNSGDVPELLDENKALLGTSQSGSIDTKALVKFKLGRYAGQHVNQENIIQDRNFDPTTGRISKIFYAPDGLVYKWKEGIGIFTQFGSNLTVNDASKVGNVNIAREPFAGQDVMNVLSLLISGVPYNFATYYKAALDYDGATGDPQSKTTTAHSFLQSLRTDLIKSNALWGNFIPFKNLVVDEQSYIKGIQKVSTIVQKNKLLDAQIQELQDLNQKAIILGAASAFSETSKEKDETFLPLTEKTRQLSEQIAQNIQQIKQNDDDTIQQVGDDVSFDFSSFVDSGKSAKSLSANRRLLRRQLNFLTRRMSYNVRANEDKNLFIVDDFYDKDFDILAYEKSLTDGIKLYNNEFTSVREKIKHVANLLNLEVFCDSQGHIRCRPPQYNRMPSSVFYRMMYLKQTLNVQIFPQFLDDLFKDKLETLRERVEILEDQIRLDCAILSRNTDSDAMALILDEGATSGTADSFAFISDEASGQISEIHDLLIAANPDTRDSAQSQDLITFDRLQNNATSTKDIFSNTQKYSAIVSSLKIKELNASGISTIPNDSFLNNTRVDTLVKRIFTKSGQRVDKKDYLIKTPNKIVEVQPPTNSLIDVFKVIQELSEKIKDRQKAIKLFYSTLKNSQEFNSLDATSDTANNLLTPGVYGNSNIPEVFEHMIEDETYDDYGLNSGKRYIIKRSQIKNINISKSAPDYTAIEVMGLLDPILTGNDLPSGLAGAFPNGGNGLTTAMAVDYDMWRMYGFKQGSPINVPFLSDPVSQCGPYASMLLSRNRKNLLRGSVTISGNEFMQPGEVVFLEDRQLLFYVSAVRHTLAYGSAFTTTLELTYGHTPGEYIPNVTDIIGKLIYNNKDVADIAIHRQETSSNEINIGALLRGTDSTSLQNLNLNTNQLSPDGLSTTYSAYNAQIINNIMYQAKYLINANENQGNNVKANIELRIYYDNNNSPDSDLIDFANQIKGLLCGASENGLNAFTTVQPSNPPQSLPSDFVKSPDQTTVNLDDQNDRRSPSQKAIDAARNCKSSKSINGGGGSNPGNNDDGGLSVLSSNGSNKTEKDAIRTALFKYVIDCWISIDPVPPQTSNGS
jgi:hypothetical protein